jgi:hypothetical protein
MGIYKLLTDIHESRNWELGHAVSFLGIFVSNFCTVALQCILSANYGSHKRTSDMEQVNLLCQNKEYYSCTAR